MESTIVTYGGGEVLYKIFNAVALLMNNQTGELFKPLLILAATIGSMWGISRLAFAESLESVFLGYFFPFILTISFLMIPSTKLRIEDRITGRFHTVDHVPFALAQFSQFVSTIGDAITTSIEAVMHTVDDPAYNKKGMIFGADAAADMSSYKLRDADMERNLKEFCHQCIVYDINLERYSLDQLTKSTSLWDFIVNNTSNVRMIPYVGGKQIKNGKADLKPELCSCKDAAKKMREIFKKDAKFYSDNELYKRLPLTYQALNKLNADQQETITQQLVMNSLIDSSGGALGFAKYRAREQERSMMRQVGLMAPGSLLSTRNVLEALLYASFIFIPFLLLMPGGFQFFKNWASLLIWIQMWPPFFVILDFIAKTAAESWVVSHFNGMDITDPGLSFYTSEGLATIQENISNVAGYMSLSIPYISYAILCKADSFVHLAGSLMSPAQSGAQMASSELSSGNYNLANTSYGTKSYDNETYMQQNRAPTMSAGFTTFHSGDSTLTATDSGKILHEQKTPTMKHGINVTESINTAQQTQFQDAQTAVNTEARNYSEALNYSAKNVGDLSGHLGKNVTYSDGYSTRDGRSLSECANNIDSTSNAFADKHGLDRRTTKDMLVANSIHAGLGSGGKLGILNAGGDWKLTHSDGTAVSDNAILEEAKNVAYSKNFQESAQSINDAVKSGAITGTNDEGKRYVSGFNKALDNVENSQNSYQAAYTKMQQVTELDSWAKQRFASINSNYNSDFQEWCFEQYKEKGGHQAAFDVLNDPAQEEKRNELASGYVNELLQKKMALAEQKPFLETKNLREKVEQTYHATHINVVDKEAKIKEVREGMYETAKEEGLHKGEAAAKGEKVKEHYNDNEEKVNLKIETSKKIVKEGYQAKQANYEKNKNKSLEDRLINRPDNCYWLWNRVRDDVQNAYTAESFKSDSIKKTQELFLDNDL